MYLDIFNLKKHYYKIKNKISSFIEHINSYNILLFSDKVHVDQKKIKVNFNKILLIVGGYSFFLILLTTLIFYFTPLKYVLFFDEEFIDYQNQQIISLNRKVIFLTKELEELVSANKRLKYLEIMADSISAESLAVKKKEILKQKKNIFGGDLYFIIEKFIKDDNLIFIKPANGFISRTFDEKLGHIGIDYSLKVGTPVVAIEDGIVLFSDYSAKDGNFIIIQHRDNYTSIYKHLKNCLKEKGSKVKRGELIALSGDSGMDASGPHLHLEILKNGIPIDPLTVIVK
jgi:murein DD-endopeptidase MepM/ murein hydrolase activator NlpD